MLVQKGITSSEKVDSLRNGKYYWLGGFSFHQGACMTEEVELWALLVGLRTT